MAGPCPRCGWPILTIKVTKTKGAEILCPQPECKHSEALDEQSLPGAAGKGHGAG